MYLKSLEIQGFKSFPDKTVLNFGEDITAIVGPNGSGKSNISDALLWVMGEQSSRSLRGSKMEDVIFGGTETRNQMGFAQVTLVIDNTEHIFNRDETEVAVTRRYYRSGDSEYYINKQAVRLRDVTELFMDTGMGREGYSIIGQGKIDEILSVKSGERREIFEEAAGISKFRHRKEEAERKLERTEENLVRINDKISELELQVGPLKEQAETAKRYLVLRDEMRILEISLWLTQLENLKAGNSKLENDLAAAKAEQAEVNAAVEAQYAATEQFALLTQENDRRQEVLREEMSSFGNAAAEADAAAAVLETSLKHNEETVLRAEEELKEQCCRTEELEEKTEAHRRRLAELHEAITAKQLEIDSLIAETEELTHRAGSAAEEAEALRAKETLKLAEAAERKAERSALAAALDAMTEREATLAEERKTMAQQIAETEKKAKECRRRLENAEEDATAVRNIIEGHALKLRTGTEKAESSRARAMQLTMDLNAMDSRIHMLDEMEKDFEGFSKSVKTVMQSHLRGIHGPVAGLMETDRRYAVAMEVALGAGVQNIVVDREEDAKSAIALLKQQSAGRATFLPLTAIHGEELRETGLANEDGYVGIASELVRYDNRYKHIFLNLLGRTVVCEDLDRGIAMARRYQNRFRIVTLDGQLINRGGSMTGGSVNERSGILSRAGELKELRAKRDGLAATLAAAENEAKEAERTAEKLRYELETASHQQRESEDEVLRCEGEKRQYDALLTAMRESLESMDAESEGLAGRREENKRLALEAESAIAALEAEAQKLSEELQGMTAGESELASRSAELAEALTAKRSEAAAFGAEQAAITENLSQYETLIGSMSGDRRSKEDLIAEYRRKSEELALARDAKRAEAESIRAEEAARRTALAALADDKMKIEQERTSNDRLARELNEKQMNVERNVARLDQKRATAAMEESAILDKLWEHYELNFTTASELRIELESVSKAGRRVSELKREINSLGNVNVGAIEEFDRVNGRYSYLTSQRDDVEKSKEDLLGIIEEITKEMTSIFSVQFRLICESFQQTFRELFGGGKATLELEDENDILGCGIEIKAQPPGKALKTISLLSGGEKAFVAIALYFSILKVHPTPFCVMDEIEAALDEPNVIRVAKYMRKICEKTQFVVITHRRGTMEEADILYGVTMQERGVSRVLTINMNDVAKELHIK